MTKRKKKPVKIAFFDRDGVINSSKINSGYIGKLKDFKWIPGAKKTLKYFKNKGYKLIIVTNQSGIARNYFTLKDLNKMNRYIKNSLLKINVKIDAIYFCPYHVDGVVKKFKKKSSLRKPDNGMFKLAQKRWNIDKKKSFMIGDQKTDMIFAKKSHIKGFLFSSDNLFNFVKKSIKLTDLN